jgi:hypothetical protein
MPNFRSLEGVLSSFLSFSGEKRERAPPGRRGREGLP